jgi:hypothetical protein
MKQLKSRLSLLLLFLPGFIFAQFITAGISPGVSIGRYKRLTAQERVRFPSPVYPGISIEGNYILQGFPFPISSYNSLGMGFYTSDADTTDLQDGNGTKVLRRVNTREVKLRFGYEIPMQNEFVSLWLGWSMGWRGGKSKVVEAWNSLGTADPTTYSAITQREGSVNMGVLVSGMYEFEHFFVFGRYEFVFSPAERLYGTQSWHQVHAGVFIPVFRFI